MKKEMEILFSPEKLYAIFREIEIELSGVHRLRSNYAQKKYIGFLKQGMDDREARRRVSELLGHNRVDVTYKYVPKGMVTDENIN